MNTYNSADTAIVATAAQRKKKIDEAAAGHPEKANAEDGNATRNPYYASDKTTVGWPRGENGGPGAADSGLVVYHYSASQIGNAKIAKNPLP